ncbi:MAG: SprT-like domain-containing protein [Pleurocapsa sp.]
MKATQKYLNRREGGIIWHTQGSGKSLTMVWLAKWIKENTDDARVLIISDRYLLNVIYHSAAPKVVVRNKTYLDLYVRYGSLQEQREQVLINWYRQQLKAQLPPLIAKWEQVIGVSIDDWGVKKMKTRWGTCNIQAKRIWLNLELIKKPQHCLEYVIVHELVHLLERHHGDLFKAYMSKFMPNWNFYKEELNCLPY